MKEAQAFPEAAFFTAGRDSQRWYRAESAGANAVRLSVAESGEPVSIGKDDLFTVHPHGSGIALEASSGGWITTDGDTLRIGGEPHEFALYTGPAGNAEAPANCCGTPPVVAGITWEDARHQQIVAGAKAVLVSAKTSKNASVAAHAKIFVDDYWPKIESSLKVALKEADEKAEYTGAIGSELIFYMHFYDPDKRSTFLNYTQNAMTEFLRYYYRSLDTHDGKNLGLALHYITDLMQPMHAALFGNFPPIGDKRHTGFELAANAAAFDFPVDKIDLSGYNLVTRWRSAGQFVTEVARFAKDLFESHVRALANAKMRTVILPGPGGRPTSMTVFYNNWSEAEVRPALEKALPFAVERTAALLLWWTGSSMYSVVDAIYTRVLERPPQSLDDSGLATWGGSLRNGMTMREVVRNLALSPEFLNGVANAGSVEASIRTLYRRLLARDCGADEVDAWRGWIGGKKYVESINFFIDSEEYDKRFGPHILPY